MSEIIIEWGLIIAGFVLGIIVEMARAGGKCPHCERKLPR